MKRVSGTVEASMTDARDNAVGYMIRRIIQDPDVHYYCGYGTEAFRLLTLAVAEMQGKPRGDVETSVRAACRGIPEPEVKMLRRQIENMREEK